MSASLLRTARSRRPARRPQAARSRPPQLKAVEDREIPKIIRKQEEIGLAARDRRRVSPRVVAFRFLRHARRRRDLRARPRHPVPGRADQAAGRARHRQDRILRPSDAGALQVPEGAHQGHAEDDHTEPQRAAFPLEPGAVAKAAYPDHDAIFDDLSAAYRKAVRAFYDAGCRYLQFDDTAWAYLCSDVEMKKARDARARCRPPARNPTRRASTRRWTASRPT